MLPLKIDEVDPGATAILFSAEYEMEYLDADEDTKTKMAETSPSQMDKIITNGFKVHTNSSFANDLEFNLF